MMPWPAPTNGRNQALSGPGSSEPAAPAIAITAAVSSAARVYTAGSTLFGDREYLLR